MGITDQSLASVRGAPGGFRYFNANLQQTSPMTPPPTTQTPTSAPLRVAANPNPRDPRDPQRILIVRPSALGDAARTVPCLVALRSAYPAARIDWLINAPFADAIRAHPALGRAAASGGGGDEGEGVIPLDRTNTAAALRLMRRLRAQRYDLAIDLQGLARSGLFTRATAAPRRVGDANARELAWLGYNRRHRIDPALHAVDRMVGLLQAEGIPPSHDLTLHVPPEDGPWAAAFLGEHGLTAGRYACVAPTAQWGCKCWPIDRYAELAARLVRHEALDRKVVVLAAPHETPRVRPLLDALGQAAVCPATTVGRMMAIIQHAALLVCNDSAPLHLAVGLGVPTVSLFGPTDPAMVGPYPIGDPKHRVLRAPSAAGRTFQYRRHREDDTLIAELTVDAVWEAIRAHLR